MLLEKAQLHTVKSELEHRFLFQGDMQSIRLVLNFYELDNMWRFRPTYLSMNELEKDVRRCLRYRRGSDIIAETLSRQIHEDINRLELYVYLEGYQWGRVNQSAINQLEIYALSQFSPWELSQKEELYHRQVNDEKLVELRQELLSRSQRALRRRGALGQTLTKFSQVFCKDEVRRLNDLTSRQMVMDIDGSSGEIKDEYGDLTPVELERIYRKLNRFIYRNAAKVFEVAAWSAINDGVLERYV